MRPFTRHVGIAAVLDLPHVDTDQIVPVQFLTRTRAEGFADALFYNLRRGAAADERGIGALDGASILIAGRNFGCGSAREQAVWALMDCGFRCIIAPSFGGLFAGNAANNGLLLVTLDDAAMSSMREAVAGPERREMVVDLVEQVVVQPDGQRLPFPYDPFWKEALLAGQSELDVTLALDGVIAPFECAHRERLAWMFDRER
jgi:3-isopropylmalate/(R)-2-methylmalate dehydratase small subunit